MNVERVSSTDIITPTGDGNITNKSSSMRIGGGGEIRKPDNKQRK